MHFPRNILLAPLLCLGHHAGAQVTNTAMTSADAFLCTGSPNYQNGADLTGLNFGGAGTLAIAPASSAKGEFRSVIKFTLTNLVAQFDTAFGTNNWVVTNIALELTSNYGTAGVQPNNPIFNVIRGGRFVIEWMADDGWIEGTGNPSQPTTDGITYSQLPDFLTMPHIPLCTNTYTPPGNDVHVIWPLPLETNLVADIASGSDVSFYFYAADEQVAYLFNSYKYGRGNEPLLHMVAAAQPVELKILSGTLSNGVFHLTAIGGANLTYRIQANTNLATTNWLTLASVAAATNGVITFDDFGAATNTQRFYRLSQ